MITALETTPGTIAENKKLQSLLEQHEANTGVAAQTVVGDSKYGTAQNYVACQQQGITTHHGQRIRQTKSRASAHRDIS